MITKTVCIILGISIGLIIAMVAACCICKEDIEARAEDWSRKEW